MNENPLLLFISLEVCRVHVNFIYNTRLYVIGSLPDTTILFGIHSTVFGSWVCGMVFLEIPDRRFCLMGCKTSLSWCSHHITIVKCLLLIAKRLLQIKENSTAVADVGVYGVRNAPLVLYCFSSTYTLLTHHGPRRSPASSPESPARLMARSRVSAGLPGSQHAYDPLFPGTSGHWAAQSLDQPWSALECWRGSGPFQITNMANWIVILLYVYFSLLRKQLTYKRLNVNVHAS